MALSPAEREVHGELGSDQCIIDGTHFFMRGLIEIPVLDGEGPFAWGVWVSLSETNFERASVLWNVEDRVNEPAYFGWLSSSALLRKESSKSLQRCITLMLRLQRVLTRCYVGPNLCKVTRSFA